ncbi:MAG: acylneuraminate cytidylyltransferase family protein [Candidatus Azobacteroides sp.]|nr:acylneuraminate cytidylyltransferase family protein [Candidatus Azobacteroides sp.]
MYKNKRILAIIPARGGSKGIPHKNIKELNGKPLIIYSIDIARQVFTDENICVTTDDQQIIDVVENYGLHVPFVRPAYLATDEATTHDVLMHALNFYEQKGIFYDIILLLQPTSPFRLKQHLEEAMDLYTDSFDMIVSVKEASANPYYNLFEEDEFGHLHVSKGNGKYTRRQDAPTVWEYNGSIYVINVKSLKGMKMSDFTRKKKYCMQDIYSIDIDTPLDWMIAEEFMKKYD